jgi:glycosyltransferase involved in cell wall biosynthesis
VAKSQPRPRQAATVAAPIAAVSVDTSVVPGDAGSSPDHANSGVEMRLPVARPSVSPENTVFVSLCFEGPDHYATAGGLGTRVAALTETLATQGYETHLIYVGDPGLPPVERRVDGQLHLKRWCQAISRQYRHGVYDGEDHKVYDYTESVARHVCHDIAEPAVAAGKLVIIIAEDWHTAEAISRVSDLLHERGLRQRAVLLWNCNSLMSLHRIDFARLSFTSTITTVSRYMKHRLWDYGVNPLVIPNGIPARYLDPVDQVYVSQLREILRRGDPNRLILFKVARFDPDKRWMMAIEAAAQLKQSGYPLAFLLRGGIEPHGAEVLARARELGLRVRDVEAGGGGIVEFLGALREAGQADLYNLRFFVPPEIGRVCYAAADATLANSGHEPFGLVGLEVMAAGGIAVTGSTGEDYAEALGNALVLETDDPDELVGAIEHLVRHPAERDRIRAAGKRTAAAFVWEQAIEHLTAKVGYLIRKQGIALG